MLHPDTFDISPKIPEFLRYTNSDCDKLRIFNKINMHVHGAIKEFKYLSPGFNYKKLPQFNISYCKHKWN